MRSKLGQAWDVLKESVDDFFEDGCPMHAAALSYYTIFSLPPLLAILILLAGFVWNPSNVQGAIEAQIRNLIGTAGATQVREMLEHKDPTDGAILPKIAGIALLLFGSTGAFLQLQTSLNRAWEVEPVPGKGQIRDFFMKRVFSFGLILGIFFLMMVSLVLTAGLSALSTYVGGGLPKIMLLVLENVVAFGIITLLFAAMFKLLPDADMDLRDVWLGALVTSFLFLIGKFALGYYLGRGNPGSSFGAAGSLAIILIWVYYAANTILFGAELTQSWVERYGNGIRPKKGASFVIERKERVRPRLTKRQRIERAEGEAEEAAAS